MSNAIRCINHRFAFKNSGIACLALIFYLSYLRSTILHPKKLCETVTVQVICQWLFIYLFFLSLIRTNGWVVKAGRWQSGGMGSFMVLNPSATQLPFCVALTPSVHWHESFLYSCALYIIFFGFHQWRSRADITLNMNIRLPILEPHCCLRAKIAKVPGHCFSLNCRKYF